MFNWSKPSSYLLGQECFRSEKIPLFELSENLYLETTPYPLSQLVYSV
jgi:hypothetical protein